ncbi:nucleoside deaminase [Mariprofundus sp. EBB-1]|nr:nucleoside deaminase [Mariprofundus sp. EBB-1]
MMSNAIDIRIPDWLIELVSKSDHHYATSKARMMFAISLAQHNIDHGTGGPFGAAIFDIKTHQLIAVGVNLVVSSHCSIAHAEMIAISMAQQQLGSFDLANLSQQPGRGFELVTSCEPCAMCFGAIPWSGIKHLVCGARDEDARGIGFDEGPKMDAWRHALEQRGITVETDICRQSAIDVLQYYATHGGAIYNAGESR